MPAPNTLLTAANKVATPALSSRCRELINPVAVISGWVVKRKLDRLDLVEVLKTRE